MHKDTLGRSVYLGSLGSGGVGMRQTRRSLTMTTTTSPPPQLDPLNLKAEVCPANSFSKERILGPVRTHQSTCTCAGHGNARHKERRPRSSTGHTE
jgi:hypothetical protein